MILKGTQTLEKKEGEGEKKKTRAECKMTVAP